MQTATATTPRFLLLGLDDEVTTCDLCGKQDLKCTMALAELDQDGTEVGIVRYGRDCGARALGWKVSADRAEKLVRGTARVSYEDAYRIWTAHLNAQDCSPKSPARGTLQDGVEIQVWSRFYLGRLQEQGWSPVPGVKDLHWRVAR